MNISISLCVCVYDHVRAHVQMLVCVLVHVQAF
jgi:hypothetical protein